MAVPRVFISSTYYDLKQVRFNIGDFIKNLGYEAVMHERSGVAYTQNEPLENDCYHELSSCDIVVCVIGNHFGSQSLGNELSITMNEIKTAIKNKKKVYIFIAKDVLIENRTYEQNKGTGSFRSAYTDDLRIHEFISELKSNVKVHVITSFETTDEIISTLKLQFAGLFQNLLAREASTSEAKIIADLDETATNVRDTVQELQQEQEAFFKKFDSTVFGRNYTLRALEVFLGLDKAAIFARNVEALDELMKAFGYKSVDVDNEYDDRRKYVKELFLADKCEITLKHALFNSDGSFKDIRSNSELEKNLICTVIPHDDSQLPF